MPSDARLCTRLDSTKDVRIQIFEAGSMRMKRVPSTFFPGILLSRKPPETQGKRQVFGMDKESTRGKNQLPFRVPRDPKKLPPRKQ